MNTLFSGAEKQLAEAGVNTARLDALVLIEDVTRIDRAQILADPDREVSAQQQAELTKLLNRRAQHEPLAYIRGKAEFYGREFVINHDVLVPRPESEAMIDMLKAIFVKNHADDGSLLETAKKSIQAKSTVNIADVGAGSGALGITAAIELKSAQNVHVDLLEIDQKAAEVAKTNVDKYTMPISVIVSDLMGATTTDYDILLCNLPYVPDEYEVNEAASHEPHIALYGGPDGLDLYRRLFIQLADRENVPLFLLTESLPAQHEDLAAIAAQNHHRLAKTDDFIQLFVRYSLILHNT